MKPYATQRVALRGLLHNVLTWGAADAPKLFLLHGWMDVAASFQFLVDAFTGNWRVVAPDLRGFGRSDWQPQGYWFADYVADLEALLDMFAPGEAVDLIGHSLGGNVAMQYAGVRPQRVRALVSLDGFGIPAERRSRRTGKIRGVARRAARSASIRSLREPRRRRRPAAEEQSRASRASRRCFSRATGRRSPRMAARGSCPTRGTSCRFRSCIAWRRRTPSGANIAAPTLWVAAADSNIPRWLDDHPEGEGATDSHAGVRRRLAHIPNGRLEIIGDAGHMLHHDQPAAVAAAIETFLAGVAKAAT